MLRADPEAVTLRDAGIKMWASNSTHLISSGYIAFNLMAGSLLFDKFGNGFFACSNG
jgi:hypothetical protein